MESHANVRSTIHLQLPHMEATGADLLPSDLDAFGDPHTADATPGMLHDLDRPAESGCDPVHETALLVSAIGPDELHPRKAASKGSQQEFAAMVILDVGFMHQHVQQEPIGIDEQMALAPFHAFAAIVAAQPPFWLVLTD